jgi:hypothetical protein
MWKAVDEWRNVHKQSTLTAEITPSSLTLQDRRAGYPHADYTYEGLARDLYLALDGVHSDSFLMDFISAKYPDAGYTRGDIKVVLDEFVERDLVLREENLYFALAILPLDQMNDDAPEKLGTAAEPQQEVSGARN